MSLKMTPKMFSTTATIVLGLFSVYGSIASIFYYKELSKFPTKGEWPFNQRFTVYLVIAVNTVYIISAVLGLFALIVQQFCIYLWASFILLGTFAVQLLHGVACVRASLEPMNKEIFSTFRLFQNDPIFTSWLRDFQWQFDCCGIKSYMDWNLFQDPKYNNYSVPDSCCNRRDRMPVPNCGHGIIAPNTTVESVQMMINTFGCGHKISQIYQLEIRTTGFILLTVAFLALFSGLMLIFLHQNLKPDRAPRNSVRTNQSALSGNEAHRRVSRAKNLRGHASRSVNSSLTSQMDINANTHKVPSYYKTAVLHKPPTGRGRMQRQDSTRNFQTTKTWAQKHNAKYQQRAHFPKYRYNPGLTTHYHGQRQATNKSPRASPNGFVKTNLEMLMHPIETHSTSSATPNPSDLFPFYGDQASSSACFQPSDFDPRVATMNRSKNGDFKISHYNSLPQVVTYPDGRVETLYHYNNSHLHAQNNRASRKHSQRPPKTPTTFIEGKYPSLTITSTLATIHEENESVKSGNSQASSTCTTTASSSPKSLSKSPSKHTEPGTENGPSLFDIPLVNETQESMNLQQENNNDVVDTDSLPIIETNDILKLDDNNRLLPQSYDGKHFNQTYTSSGSRNSSSGSSSSIGSSSINNNKYLDSVLQLPAQFMNENSQEPATSVQNL